MYDGKKSTAEKIVYGALDFMKEKTKSDPLTLFHEALNNVKPSCKFLIWWPKVADVIILFLRNVNSQCSGNYL